jgi:addiction module RelE/StbE family toxin
MEARYRKTFVKQYRKLPQVVQKRVQERINLFRTNPFEPLLSNHPLHGHKRGYRSINITGDYRALYEEIDGVAYFAAVGTHSELYG